MRVTPRLTGLHVLMPNDDRPNSPVNAIRVPVLVDPVVPGELLQQQHGIMIKKTPKFEVEFGEQIHDLRLPAPTRGFVTSGSVFRAEKRSLKVLIVPWDCPDFRDVGGAFEPMLYGSSNGSIPEARSADDKKSTVNGQCRLVFLKIPPVHGRTFWPWLPL